MISFVKWDEHRILATSQDLLGATGGEREAGTTGIQHPACLSFMRRLKFQQRVLFRGRVVVVVYFGSDFQGHWRSLLRGWTACLSVCVVGCLSVWLDVLSVWLDVCLCLSVWLDVFVRLVGCLSSLWSFWVSDCLSF